MAAPEPINSDYAAGLVKQLSSLGRGSSSFVTVVQELRYALDRLKPAQLIQSSPMMLIRHGLSDEADPRDTLVALDQVARIVSDTEGFTFFKDSDLAKIVFHLIESENVGVAEKAIDVFALHIANRGEEGRVYLFTANGTVNAAKARLKELTAKQSQEGDGAASIAMFRLLDLLAKARILLSEKTISTKREDLFRLSLTSGVIDIILAETRSEDILHRLSCIELEERIASTLFGIRHLSDTGVLGTLIDTLRSGDDENGGLLLPRYLGLIASVARAGNEVVQVLLKFPVIEVLASLLSRQKNEVEVLIAIGALGSSRVGLEALTASPDLLPDFATYLYSSDTDLKVVCVIASAEIFHRETLPSGEEFNQLKKFFQLLSKEDPILLYLKAEILAKPFFDVRRAGYAFLKNVAPYSFAKEQLVKVDGFAAVLLDRNLEDSLLGHEWKFSVIQRFVENPEESKKLLGLQIYRDFLEYLKRGVVWNRPEAHAILEDEAGF